MQGPGAFGDRRREEEGMTIGGEGGRVGDQV